MRIADSLGHTFFGFILSLALTFLALYVALYTTLPLSTVLTTIIIMAVAQALLQLIMFMHLKRRRRKSSNSYNDIQFLRCNCNSWFNCMDLLLNVMYMKKTAEIPQQSFFLSPLLHPHYGINSIIMKKYTYYDKC